MQTARSRPTRVHEADGLLDVPGSRRILSPARNPGNGVIMMAFATDYGRWWPFAAATLALVVLAAPPARGQVTGPFEVLAGSWSGTGTVHTSDGLHEGGRGDRKR